MKAAARTYFGKDLKDLTLAQDAILAAIPQSPTTYDLVKNAEQVCDEAVPAGGDVRPQDPASSSRPTPRSSPRRNYILDLMKTAQPAVAARATRLDEYEAAKTEPVVLAPQLGNQLAGARSSSGRSASQLGDDPLPRTVRRRSATKIDTGGYQVTTTLDMEDAGDDREVALRGGPGAEPQGHRDATSRT